MYVGTNLSAHLLSGCELLSIWGRIPWIPCFWETWTWNSSLNISRCCRHKQNKTKRKKCLFGCILLICPYISLCPNNTPPSLCFSVWLIALDWAARWSVANTAELGMRFSCWILPVTSHFPCPAATLWTSFTSLEACCQSTHQLQHNTRSYEKNKKEILHSTLLKYIAEAY